MLSNAWERGERDEIDSIFSKTSVSDFLLTMEILEESNIKKFSH